MFSKLGDGTVMCTRDWIKLRNWVKCGQSTSGRYDVRVREIDWRRRATLIVPTPECALATPCPGGRDDLLNPGSHHKGTLSGRDNLMAFVSVNGNFGHGNSTGV